MTTVVQHSASCSRSVILQFPVKPKLTTFPACGFDALDCSHPDHHKQLVHLLEMAQCKAQMFTSAFTRISKQDKYSMALAEHCKDLEGNITAALIALKGHTHD